MHYNEEITSLLHNILGLYNKIKELFIITYLDNGNMSSLNHEQSPILQNITCREDFNKINYTCEPRCDRFIQTSHTGSQIYIYTELISSCLAILICIPIVALLIKNYKKMSVIYNNSYLYLNICLIIM